MMKTQKPSAIIYGWYKEGSQLLVSDIYFEEHLYDDVVIHSLVYQNNIVEDVARYNPDLIITFKDKIELKDEKLKKIYLHYHDFVPDNILANDIVCQTVFRNTDYIRPKFSIFTPTYKTKERIWRTYNSLVNQTFANWEWVIVDDSPDEDTWKILNQISKKDYRVKLHRIYPLSEGNIGLAKHRAASLGDGDWLVELDHDDELTTECLEICNEAILRYPDAGFLYSNGTEIYENGDQKTYDHDWSGGWYGRDDNFFNFGYSGHEWVEVDGKKMLSHFYPDINPLSIRFNITMPNHVRMWERKLYHQIGGHNKKTPVADDFEMIVKTFLHTRFIHVKKLLYIQNNNFDSTVDNNSIDINRRARLIRDHYDLRIHNRIQELGCYDWNWDDNLGHSQKFQNRPTKRMFYENEQIMNYIYE